MGRILAIDYGRKRTVMAVTDPLQIIASPLLTLPTCKLEEYLSEYLKNEKVDAIVVGYPKKMNNTPSEAVKYINPFLKRISKLFPDMPVYLEDERLTSVISRKTILEGGVKKKERMDKSLADKISASLILQSFLEKREFKS